MRILVGYDGSPHSDAAIDDLKLAGIPRDTDIVIASVGDLLMSSPEISEVLEQALTPERVERGMQRAKTHAETVTKEAADAAKRAEERITGLFPEANVNADVLIGTPAWMLIDAAEKIRADLIVVGSQGRSALNRLFLGGVSKRVVTDANCSVRVGRPRSRTGSSFPPRIIIGVDGSPASELAVYSVGQRVWPEGAEVQLLAVDESTSPVQIATRLPQATAMIREYFQKRESRVSEMIEWAVKELNNIGIGASVIHEKGDPKTVILAKAREWDADSIFVGTRDFKSGFERFRLGSVSTAVVTNAHCSVEVVRPSEAGLTGG